jgi:hypothetical protein
MTEIGGIVGIYGAIDQVVQTDSESRAAVSQLLPLYRDPHLHWFDKFEAWLRGTKAHAAAALFPSLPDALHELAGIDPLRRMRPRRLFAIAVAMQAFPEMRDPHNELGTLAVAALRPRALAGEEERALALHGLLAEEASLPGLEGSPPGLGTWWEHLITAADAQGLISSTTGMFPRPCSGRLVTVPGLTGPVAALETEFETDEIEFDQATRFIEPVNWKTCMPWFWCDMTRLGAGLLPGTYLYREVVSTDCADRAAAAFWAETELEFNFMWLPGVANPAVALTNYQLSKTRPLPGDLIRVDEGSLLVAKTGPGPTPLRITTTKRIQFSYPFSSQALAMIMCALGYADVVGDLLCCAASGSQQAGVPFPGVAPASPQQAATPKHACGAIPGNVAAALGECVEECAAAAGDWSRRVSEGPYTADEFAQDMASTWARVLRKGATAVNLGAPGIQTGTRTRTSDRTEA